MIEKQVCIAAVVLRLNVAEIAPNSAGIVICIGTDNGGGGAVVEHPTLRTDARPEAEVESRLRFKIAQLVTLHMVGDVLRRGTAAAKAKRTIHDVAPMKKAFQEVRATTS